MDSFGHLSVEAIRASVHANHANHANQNASRPASSRTIIKNYPYTPSIASSASSSSSSVFSSTDAQSSQSSAPSSVKSATANWEPENSGVEHGLANHDPLSFNTNQDPVINSAQTSQPTVTITTRQLPLLQGENTAPQESQVHPRRTQPLADSQDGKPSARPPPALVRQCDRKDNFVESLVGKLARNASAGLHSDISRHDDANDRGYLAALGHHPQQGHFPWGPEPDWA